MNYPKLEAQHDRVVSALGFDPRDRDLEDTHRSILRALEKTRKRWQQYIQKREEIVSPYYRKVYTQARDHSSKGNDAQTLDNFQNGYKGLLKAYSCYTPGRFAAFSVVAESWIRQSILLEIKSEVNLIKLPIANWHIFQKLDKSRKELEKSNNGGIVKLEEMAAHAGVPLDKAQKVYENVKLAKVLSLNLPTQNEEEQNEGANWSLESVEYKHDMQKELESVAEYQIMQTIAQDFDTEETVIFGLMTGCLDLIENEEFDPQEVLQEKVRQAAAKHGIQVIFK